MCADLKEFRLNTESTGIEDIIMVFPGWEITRLIPPDMLMGLLTGQYKLYGGVIRWAAGTQNAGQIVAHLLPAGSQLLNFVPGLNFIPGLLTSIQLSELKDMTQFNTVQLAQLSTQVGALSQTTQQVLQVATGTAVLSGLGLAVSCIGFIAINKKLNTIDSKLKDIQKDVKAIQQFLESSERAKLFAALDSLLKLDKTPDEHAISFCITLDKRLQKSICAIANYYGTQRRSKLRWRMKNISL